jgi:hypothetical protein
MQVKCRLLQRFVAAARISTQGKSFYLYPNFSRLKNSGNKTLKAVA